VSCVRLPAEMETERRNLGLNPPVSSEKGAKNSVLICEQLSSVLLEVQSRAEIAGTVVAERQHVLASIISATRDVGHPFQTSFRDVTTAICRPQLSRMRKPRTMHGPQQTLSTSLA
jgi:hypothetical protein